MTNRRFGKEFLEKFDLIALQPKLLFTIVMRSKASVVRDDRYLDALFSNASDYFTADLVSFTTVSHSKHIFLHKLFVCASSETKRCISPYGPEFISARVIAKKSIIAIESSENVQGRLKYSFLLPQKIKSYIAAPVYQNSVCMGAFEVLNAQKRRWNENDKRNIKICAGLLEAFGSKRSFYIPLANA